MQLCSLYLYPNHLDLFTNLDMWVSERYRRVYNRNLKLYRGLDNKIEFRVRSSDQKFKNIGDSIFVMNIINSETKKLLLSKDITTQDSSTGKLYVIIESHELQHIESGIYDYTIFYETRNNIDSVLHSVSERYPVYFDSQYDSFGNIEIINDVFGDPSPSNEIKEFKFNVQYDTGDDFYLSGIIDANSQLVTPQSLHTFQMYFSDYTGRVTIQGSLDRGGNPQVWSDLAVLDYINVNKEYVNLTGKYSFFRIKHVPNLPGLLGSFEIDQTIFGYYNVSILNPGRGYSVGNQLTIKGNTLGGSTPSNDLIITITGIDDSGGIIAFAHTGRSYNGTSSFVRGSANIPNTGKFDKILYR